MHRGALTCQATLSGQGVVGRIPRRSKCIYVRHQSSSTSDTIRKPPPRLPQDQYDRAKRDTLKIIDRVARQPSNWKHTPSLRGEEKRLAASIPLEPSRNRISIEKTTYDADHEAVEDEVDGSPPPLPVGTFVETRRNLILSHGVVLGQIFLERRRRLVILTTTGEIWQPVREDVLFHIPDFVPSNLVARCGLQVFPTEQTQIRARIEVLKRLKEHDRIMEKTYNSVSHKCADVYHKVRPSDLDNWSQTTVTEVACLITRKPDITTIFAIHKYMMSNPLFFIAHNSYETNQVFYVRPKSHVDDIHTIQDWSRRRDGPIQSFAKKARQIITANQQTQRLSRSELPSFGPAAHVWSETDRRILTFLQNSLRRTRTTQLDPYSLGQSFILKQIYPTGPRVDDTGVHKTLVDLGVLAPWQDLMVLEPALDLEFEPEAMSSRVKAQEAIAEKGFASLASSMHKTPLGPEDLYPSDPLDSVRHDFGDLPVFVIDEATAEELDDGVSIERIPSEPNNFWVHIHIADPASLIPPTHVLAKEASIRLESAYFIHRSWSLFPRSLMKHPQYGLSLGAKEDGLPTKVLTFSAKVNSQGEMTDYKVRGGLIRKIHVVTYDEVDAALGSAEAPRWSPFGRIVQSKRTARTWTESQIKDLQDLHTTAARVVAKRQRDGIIQFSRPIPSIRSIAQPPPEISGPTFEPTTFRGFPTFAYELADMSALDTGAHNMVAEMSKLASRTASRFATERGIPMIRRSSDPGLMGFSVDQQELLNMRTPNNYVRHDFSIYKTPIIPSARYSLEPKAHYGLGVPEGEGYARATSPLRRYLDLVAHWQIHHALLGSAAPTSTPPFDAAQMSELLIAVQAGERLLQGVVQNHELYWQLMLLKRWAEDTANGAKRHDDPLQRLEATTMGNPSQNDLSGKFHVEVHIRLIGLRASLENLDSPDVPPGTRLPVKIQECRLGVRPQLLVVRK